MKITGTAPTASEFECPPEDVYTLEFIGHEEQPVRPGFGGNTDIEEYSVRLFFKIVDYDYDPDEDDQDWNGTEIRQFYVWQRFDKKKQEMFSTYLSEKSKANAIFNAILGRPVTEEDELDLRSMEGRRIKATIVENKRGYPEIQSPVRAKSPKAARKERRPVTVPDDRMAADDDEEWPDD